MSANIDKTKLPLKAVLKPTGFYPPKRVENLTLEEAIASDNPDIEQNKEVTITTETAEITPSDDKDAMKKVSATVALEEIEETIDVTTYTEPITFTPGSGKAGIKSIKITLAGI